MTLWRTLVLVRCDVRSGKRVNLCFHCVSIISHLEKKIPLTPNLKNKWMKLLATINTRRYTFPGCDVTRPLPVWPSVAPRCCCPSTPRPPRDARVRGFIVKRFVWDDSWAPAALRHADVPGKARQRESREDRLTDLHVRRTERPRASGNSTAFISTRMIYLYSCMYYFFCCLACI